MLMLPPMCGAWVLLLGAQTPNDPRIISRLELAPTPPALVEMMERRLRGLKSAHVESAWHWHDRDRTTFFTHKFAESSLLEVRRGDADGLVFPATAGQPFSHSPIYVLREGRTKSEWKYIEGSLGAGVRLEDEEFTSAVYDFRVWGLQPIASGPSNYDFREGHFDPRIVMDAVYRDRAASARQEDIGGGMVRVTLGFNEGGGAVYELSEREDFSPHLIVVTDGQGQEVWKSTFRCRKTGDRWFPHWMHFEYHGEPLVTVDVLHASFNDPAHPAQLAPGAELGLPAGTNLTVWSRGGQELRYWDGEGIATLEDYSDGLREGRIDNSEFLHRCESNKTDPPGRFPTSASRLFVEATSDLLRCPRLWEQYTRDFITLYNLKPDQASAAWAVWRECHDSAATYLADRQREIDAAERTLRALRASPDRPDTDARVADESRDVATSADPPNAPDKGLSRQSGRTNSKSSPETTRIEGRVAALWAPVESVFAQRLKPRLKSLLTQDQIAAGNEAKRRLESLMQSSFTADD